MEDKEEKESVLWKFLNIQILSHICIQYFYLESHTLAFWWELGSNSYFFGHSPLTKVEVFSYKMFGFDWVMMQ